MKNKNVYILGILGIGLFTSPIWAEEAKKQDQNTGKFNVSVKAMTILDAEDNGYDPNDGSSYLLKLKYQTPVWSKARLGVGLYTNGDFFDSTDFDTERVARGMFVTDDGTEESQLGELYVDYKPGQFHLFGGRMLYDTPLTTISYSNHAKFLHSLWRHYDEPAQLQTWFGADHKNVVWCTLDDRFCAHWRRHKISWVRAQNQLDRPG